MRTNGRVREIALVLGLILAVASISCSSSDKEPSPFPSALDGGSDDAGVNKCVDKDKDGFGKNCKRGKDCDDKDPKVTDECYRCTEPAEGCPCDPGSPPELCYLDSSKNDAGQTVCYEGTRYCRNGVWTGCESVRSYAVSPSSSDQIIDPNLPHPKCDICATNCYKVVDNLMPVDGGLNGTNSSGSAVWASGGGLTLVALGCPDGGCGTGGTGGGNNPDAGAPTGPSGECQIGNGIDSDCDGIPNTFDPYPTTKPFSTNNPAIFMRLGPGQSGSSTLNLDFNVKTVDIYFLLDQTATMIPERVNLNSSLISTPSGTSYLGDYQCGDWHGPNGTGDPDGLPDNYLKDQGVIGAIRCVIRNAWFGAGFVREYSWKGHADEIIGINYQDVIEDPELTRRAIERMTCNGNLDFPEGQTQMLYSVATGEELYTGYTYTGVPGRQDCPEGRWGLPCFRKDAIPVIILFTDDWFHNGPAGNAYDKSYRMRAGTTAAYLKVPGNTNEKFSNAYNVGDVTDKFVTVTGDTYSMKSDVSAVTVGCNATDTAPDAVFKFNVTAKKTITIATVGSYFDTVLSLHKATPKTPPSTVSVSGNDTQSLAYDLGDIYGSNGWFIGAGDTSALQADYQGSIAGCNARSGGKDAVFKFTLSQPTKVEVSTEGSSFDTVLSLYNGAIPHATKTTIEPDNDTFATASNAGEIYGGYFKELNGGSTDAANIHENYLASTVGCNADSASPDAVVKFHLNGSAKVRIDTEDSDVGSGLDTVTSLHGGVAQQATISVADNHNEDTNSAWPAGDVSENFIEVQGDTSIMRADYTGSSVGCNADTNSHDAVVSFSVSQTTPIQIDTEGSNFDTVLAIGQRGSYTREYNYALDNINNENCATAFNLGNLSNAKVTVSGTSTGSLYDMGDAVADYTAATIGCGVGDASPDLAFKFSVSQQTKLRIDASQSSFDNVISLHNGQPPTTVVTPVTGNETWGAATDLGVLTGKDLRFSGDTTSMTANYPEVQIGCSGDTKSPDAVFKIYSK